MGQKEAIEVHVAKMRQKEAISRHCTGADCSSWRIPIALNLVWVVGIFGALFIIPESRMSHSQDLEFDVWTESLARWLLYRGKGEKAEKALHKIHDGSPDSDVLVAEQLAILNKSREEEAESSSGQSKWSDLWSEPPFSHL